MNSIHDSQGLFESDLGIVLLISETSTLGVQLKGLYASV